MADTNTDPGAITYDDPAPAGSPAIAPAPSAPNAALDDAASAAPKGSDITYDDPAPKTPGDEDTSPTLGSIAMQLPTGFNEGLADTLGAPVDITTWLANKVLPESHQIKEPFGGSDSIKSGLGYLPMGGADPRNAPAKNAAERIVRGVGSGAAAAVAPEAALGSAVRAGIELPSIVGGESAEAIKAADAAKGAASTAPTTADAVTTAIAGGVGGGTGKTASEIVPDQYKPYADLAGNIIGGGATALASEIPGKAVSTATAAVKPFTKSGQEDLAAAKLASAATSRHAVLESLDNGTSELVPGSKPTTFQQTGDMGLGELERSLRTDNPGLFQQRKAEQNAARVNSLSGVQETGAPDAVSSYLRDRLGEIDKTTQSAIDLATDKAKQATAALGPGLDTAAHGQNISSALTPQVESATREAATRAENLGGQGTPEQHGTALRQSLADAEQNARAQERQLWQSVDPDRKLVVATQPVSAAAESAYGQLSPAAVIAMTPAEHNALAAVNSLGDAVHLQDITDLRSSLSGDMRAEQLAHGNSPAYRRLSILRGSIDDAINGTINGQVEQDSAAAAAGTMRPEETLGAKLQREADAFRAARRTPDEGGETPEGEGPTGIVPGGSRVTPEEPLAPNFTDEDKARLDAATAATRQRATTFGQGDVGQVLRRQTNAPDYKMIASAVPDKTFHSGNTGGEDVRAYLAATGNDPQAAAALHNYAAYSLRRAAMRPDGTIDPRKYAAWTKNNAEALNALPAEVRQNFANVAQASEALNRFAPFRPDMAPSQTPELFFHAGPSGGDGVRQFKSLVGEDAANKMLSDYAADTLVAKASRPDGTLDPAKFETWRKQHADALNELPGLADKFSSAANATKAIGEAAEARATALDNYQKGAVGKLLKVEEPEDVTRAVGRMFGAQDSVAQFKRLAAEVGNNPAAKEGLRKAIVDHMLNKFLGNTEAATSGTSLIKADAFQTFVRTNLAALKTVFTPEEIGSMNAIAADLKRAARSDNAVRIAGQSNTPQDLASAAKYSAEQTVLQRLIGQGIGGAFGSMLSRIPGAGAVGAIAGGAVTGMRNAAMSKVDDLVRKAMLDPDLAKTLLKRAPTGPNRGSYLTLATKLKRASLFGAVQAATQQHNGTGGAVAPTPRRITITGGTVVGGPQQ